MAKNIVIGKEKVKGKSYTIILNPETKLFECEEKIKMPKGMRIPGVSSAALEAGKPACGMYSALVSAIYKVNGLDYKEEKAKAEKKAAKSAKKEKTEKKKDKPSKDKKDSKKSKEKEKSKKKKK